MRDMDCRWITCDEHFKYNTCLKCKAFADALYDRFEEMGWKYPECAMAYDDACHKTEGCGFENVRREDGTKSHDAELDEREACDTAKRKVSELLLDNLRGLYTDLAYKVLVDRRREQTRLENEIFERLDDLCLPHHDVGTPGESFSDILSEIESYDSTPPPKGAWLDIAERLRKWFVSGQKVDEA